MHSIRFIGLLGLFVTLMASSSFAKKPAPKKTDGRTPQAYLTEEEEVSESIAEDSNCKIIINTEHFTGVKESQTIHTQATSKSDCEKRSKPHRHNFYPKEIKEKVVSFTFQEGK